MSRSDAEALASVVAEATDVEPQVIQDGDWFVVRVTTAGGSWNMDDEADWLWLQARITASP
jgi:hypothetical protein